MSEYALRKTLDVYLNDMAGRPPIGFENVAHDSNDELHYLTSYLTAEAQTVGVEPTGSDVLLGILQVTVCVPKDAGPGQVTTEIDRIKARFARGVPIEQNGIRVNIIKVFSGPAFSSGGYWRTPGSIRYSVT